MGAAGAGAGHHALAPVAAAGLPLRASLRPGILKTLAYNASHRLKGLGVFEIGHVYRWPSTEQPLPDEREHLAVGLGGRDATGAVAVWSALAAALAAALSICEQVRGQASTRCSLRCSSRWRSCTRRSTSVILDTASPIESTQVRWFDPVLHCTRVLW